MKGRLLQSINLDFRDNISPADLAVVADLFCSLNFKSAVMRRRAQELNSREALLDAEAEQQAEQQQAEVSAILAECYEHGNAELGLPRDPWRAKKYGKRASPPANSKRTDDLYTSLGWYTSIRLFLLRFNRILGLVGKAFYVDTVVHTGVGFLNTLCNAVTKHITKITAIAGLSYGVELLVDLSVLFRATFLATQDEINKNPSRWSRFKNTLKKDDRMVRMANAAVWFSANLTAFFVSAGLSSILNLSLFVFDVCLDIYKAYRDKSKYARLAHALENKKATLILEMASLKDKPEERAIKQKEFAKYVCIENRLKEKSEAIKNKRYHAIVISTVILFGMALFLFPPAGATALIGLVAVKMLGASLAMAGSIFGGLGKRVYDKLTAPKPIDVELDNLIKATATPIRHIDHLLPPSPTQSPRLGRKQDEEDVRKPLISRQQPSDFSPKPSHPAPVSRIMAF